MGSCESSNRPAQSPNKKNYKEPNWEWKTLPYTFDDASYYL